MASSASSPTRSMSPTTAATNVLNDLRLSGDGDRPPTPSLVNGHDDADPLARLQHELEKTRQEKDSLAAQYHTLLQKLTQMRTTLGNKLKQDAEELDRREQQLQHLGAQNDDLASTINRLHEELTISNAETTRVTKELDTLRNRVIDQSGQEALLHERERELRDTQLELERCRMDRDEYKQEAMQERTFSDDARLILDTLRRDLEIAHETRQRDAAELETEREKSENLQSVLQDFQAAKEHELRQAVKDYESQLTQVTQSLVEFKHRALTAELALEETRTNTSRTHDLEKEVKEKNLLIGKLRHETVIINEHLMEALRRLRKNSSDTNVDRRLVTNVLLSFLTTPRADAKRFEMLSLLSTILSWSDLEREKAGLQRTAPSMVPSSSSFWGRPSLSLPSKNAELQKTDETESFSRLWVEFLLTEATNGSGAGEDSRWKNSNGSLPGSPTRASFSSQGGQSPTRRLASFGGGGAASSPNLSLTPDKDKGKGRADGS